MRGGKRQGAGPKLRGTHKRISRSFRLSKESVDYLDQHPKGERSDIVDRLILNILANKNN